MKKIVAAGALALTLPFAMSANAASDAGCGLGGMLLEGKDDLVSNVLAATLNATSGNQTFGMTTGTLGCSKSNALVSVSTFVSDNMDMLAQDAARGEGETLDTLATLWGMDDAAKARFAAATQANFAKVFSSDSVTAQEVTRNLNQLVSEDAELSSYTLS